MIELGNIVITQEHGAEIAKINGIEIFSIWNDGKEWYTEIPVSIPEDKEFSSVKEARDELKKYVLETIKQIIDEYET